MNVRDKMQGYSGPGDTANDLNLLQHHLHLTRRSQKKKKWNHTDMEFKDTKGTEKVAFFTPQYSGLE